MRIEIDKNGVRKSGEAIKQQNQKFKNDIKRLENIIDSINSAWEGDDSLKYINTMRDTYLNGLKELNECIEDYGEYLNKVSKAYDAVDSTYNSKQLN